MLLYALIIAFVTCLSSALAFYAVYKKKIHIWLPGYVRQRLKAGFINRPAQVHIMFCVVDHYEPGNGGVDKARWKSRVDEWHRRYPQMAVKFVDSDGFHPRHTWFYPPHYYDEQLFAKIVDLCASGFGEIELHLHHNRMEPFPDTHDTIKKKIEDTVAEYSEFGVFKTTAGGDHVASYAFIHGDWALDNSRADNAFCGVNSEISVLLETGCYADFTFPAYMMESQPRIVNSVYYVEDDPARPKSHDTGSLVLAGVKDTGRKLLMVQGPLGFYFKKGGFLPRLAVESGELSGNNPPTPARVDLWVRTGVHVLNRPEWVIVKLHAHGASESEHESLMGRHAEVMHKYLSDKYDDGVNYKLHYVTARELYNIIKAAEAGKTGNPGDYRDFVYGPYKYVRSPSWKQKEA